MKSKDVIKKSKNGTECSVVKLNLINSQLKRQKDTQSEICLSADIQKYNFMREKTPKYFRRQFIYGLTTIKPTIIKLAEMKKKSLANWKRTTLRSI